MEKDEQQVEEEDEEEETIHEAYKRFLTAREEQNDERYTDVLLEFDSLPDDVSKLTFLNQVMLKNEIEVMECVLRLYGKEVMELEDNNESTLMHYAAMNNHHSFVYILICLQKNDVSINLDDYNRYDQTPIVLACMYNHEDVLDVFLRYAPHVDLTDAINVAQLSENDNIMEMLLDEQDERKALKMFRKIRQAQEDVKMAKQLSEFDFCSNGDKQLLFMSNLLKTNEMDVFRMLLETRPEILSVRDEDGWTLLHTAVSQNSSSGVSVLVQEDGIDIDAVDMTHTTALMMACRSFKHQTVVRTLLDRDCDVLVKDSSGFNALDIAKRAKQKDILVLLEGHLEQLGLKDSGKLAGVYL